MCVCVYIVVVRTDISILKYNTYNVILNRNTGRSYLITSRRGTV